MFSFFRAFVIKDLCGSCLFGLRGKMDNREAERQPEENVSKKSWRIRIGTWMFYVPFGMFFGAPVIIPLLGFSATESAAAIGAIIVAAEVIWFASIPLLGKKGFKAMKSKAFGMLKPKEGPIGKVRHQIGVLLFMGTMLLHVLLGLSVLIACFKAGADDPNVPIFGLRFAQQAKIYVGIQMASVISLVLSVYALGADFWERFWRTFEWQS